MAKVKTKTDDRVQLRSPVLQSVRKKIEEDGDCGDLVVGEGETRVLSSTAQWCRPFYREVQPKGVAQLKEILGAPASVAHSKCGVPNGASRQHLVNAEDRRLLRTRSLSPASLSDEELPEGELAENLRLARVATEHYVYGDPSALSHWTAVIDAFLNLKGAVLLVPFFNDIVVRDGGTLQVANNTYAVYANRIRLYGSGRIDCQGPTTFDCTSFEGFLA